MGPPSVRMVHPKIVKGRPPGRLSKGKSRSVPVPCSGFSGEITQSAEGAKQPSPDREVGVGEEYDGEPRRVRHKGAKEAATPLSKLRTKPNPSGPIEIRPVVDLSVMIKESERQRRKETSR